MYPNWIVKFRWLTMSFGIRAFVLLFGDFYSILGQVRMPDGMKRWREMLVMGKIMLVSAI